MDRKGLFFVDTRAADIANIAIVELRIVFSTICIGSGMVLSKPCQYAIQAMIFLAEQEEGRLYPVREISKRSNVPLPYLSKILGNLSRHGLVTARRGPSGGVMLSRGPAEVTLGEIVEAFLGRPVNGSCYLGLPECSTAHPCPIHDSWKKVRSQLDRTLHSKTLSDLKRVTDRRGRAKKSRRRSSSRGSRRASAR
jgi:Rrf2 family protein